MEKYLIADFSQRDNPDAGLREFFRDPANSAFGREPVIAMMPDGSLFCTFLSGGATEPHNRNAVLAKKSRDGGKTWSDTRVLFRHSFQGLWATEIFTGFARPMMIITMYNADYPAKAFQNFVSYTDDCGESWSEPVSVDPMLQAVSVRAGFRMSNGEVLFPLYYQVSHARFDWDVSQYYKPGWWDGVHSECSAAVTADGADYSRFGKIRCGTDSLWEPACAELEPGHIVMFIRWSNAKVLGRADSFDHGRTWTAPQRTDIPNSGSKIYAFSVNGKLALLTNFHADSRTELAMRISCDGGKTWERSIPMDAPDAFFTYPHAVVDTANERLFVVYENYKQHYLNVIRFAEAGL